MRKKVIRITGLVVFTLVLVTNLQYALLDYGIENASSAVQVFAQTGGTGGGTGGSGNLPGCFCSLQGSSPGNCIKVGETVIQHYKIGDQCYRAEIETYSFSGSSEGSCAGTPGPSGNKIIETPVSSEHCGGTGGTGGTN